MMVASVMMPKSLRSGRRSKRGWSWISGRLCEVPLELVLVFLKTIMATLDKEINFGQFLLRLTLPHAERESGKTSETSEFQFSK